MVPGRYLVDAIVLEGRSPSDVARSHGISRTWLYELVKRFRRGGYAALEPRSRRPKRCPHQFGPELEAVVVLLRGQLAAAGHDCGPQTIAQHLRRGGLPVPAVSTVWRILHRHGLITPQPQKRPRCSFVRFQAALPHELWQSDTTHWLLADGSGVEILNLVDDHSRLLLGSVAFTTVKATDVAQVFDAAAAAHGYPAAFLSDNAGVFSGRSHHGKVVLETELARLGIRAVHARPYHPQTCGKVERLHQTQKRYLAKQVPARSLAHLQLELDRFRSYYNQQRPHRALGGRTPLVAWNARIKATPVAPPEAAHLRVRTDRVGSNGTVTLRYQSKLRHIALGAAHRYEAVRLFVADDQVRVVGEDGVLIRELRIDAAKNYQPLESSAMS